MTKKNFKKKVKELLRQSLHSARVDKMVESILRENPDLIKDEEADSYRVSKKVVCAIAMQVQQDCRPLAEDRAKTSKEVLHIYNSIWNV